MAALYHIQDDDRPMYVVADTFTEALEKWVEFVEDENEEEIEEPPKGVYRVCNDNDLLL